MKPEILAPAGSYEAVKVAIHAGADAIYLGGDRFGARAYANNFDEGTLIEVITYAHLYGVKIYLTINTLFRNDEIDQLYQYLLPYYEAGIDAVIIQDLGVMHFVHMNFQDLPIHASTQMTITTEFAYTLLKNYGVTRIVPARELSLEEIKILKSIDSDLEIEVFVQGALCYCYSGQCLMSSFLGGRSGNRGRCAQPCRLPYQVISEDGKTRSVDGNYLLSPKDLCGLEVIPDLIRAGVTSFKIEGRMKKPEYVAVCVRAYRNIVDAYYNDRYDEALVQKYKREMASVFNRGGFTNGYFYQKNGKNMMSIQYPGNIGVNIGKIVAVKKHQISISLFEDLYKGDILVIQGKKDQITLTSNLDAKRNTTVVLNAPRTNTLNINQEIHRMFEKPLMDELCVDQMQERKIPISADVALFENQRAKIEIRAVMNQKEYLVIEQGDLIEQATNKPLTKDVVVEKISAIGNTKYTFKELNIKLSENVFYSLKALKDLRRKALLKLEREMISSYQRRSSFQVKKAFKSLNANTSKTISVMVSTIEQFETIQNQKVDMVYLDMQYFDLKFLISKLNNHYPFSLYIALPYIMRKNVINDIKCLLDHISFRQNEKIGLLIRNIDELSYLKNLNYLGNISIDYSLYTMNDYAADWIRSIFPNAKLTVPVELNENQIKNLSYINSNCELITYGNQKLMVSAQCLQSTLDQCDASNRKLVLVDRYQKKFFVSNICKYCYSIIYNGIPTMIFDLKSKELPTNINERIHFINEDKIEVLDILDNYNGNFKKDLKTRGHYHRGVE